ncbi:BLUF domain-containing protein [Winogradskyella bathintestinalis]|uniref:BLUF domain-containing protein n=1 Tax=Winogradskyella bathintestinalis TaxID=3035208 RepID=A0ABT7ZTU8_9FLAO|nr:BLUF domain-containing protein [Winogradskyella bathintestinalis]MDN3492389.1 BLUF domain-containing protein [Winogradskyella bathintestinalis]
MYQLNYHSQSTPGLTIEDLENILEEATATNKKRGISGCLIYHNNSFVQILEGEKEHVCEVFEKIKSDRRHHNITLLYENQISSRYFTGWNMAYHRPNDSYVIQFVNNLLMLSKLTDKASNSLLTFWGQVRRILENGSVEYYENA